MIAQILPQILLNDWFYYTLLVGLIMLVLNQLDVLGITIKREHDDCKGYYNCMGVITVIAGACLILSMVNKYVAFQIAPIMLVVCFTASQVTAKVYENCYKKINNEDKGYLEKILFIVLVIAFLFINKGSINQANYKVEKLQNNSSK